MGSHSLLHPVYSSVFEKRNGCLIGIVSSDMEKKKVKAVDIFDAIRHFAGNSHGNN